MFAPTGAFFDVVPTPEKSMLESTLIRSVGVVLLAM
jgi:hypothetical protein